MLAVCPYACDVCLCLVLIGCLPFLFATLDNDEEEVTVAGFIGEGLDILYCSRPGTNQDQGKPSQCLLPYLSLYVMHVLLLKFYKIWTNKTIFDMDITTSVII